MLCESLHRLDIIGISVYFFLIFYPVLNTSFSSIERDWCHHIVESILCFPPRFSCREQYDHEPRNLVWGQTVRKWQLQLRWKVTHGVSNFIPCVFGLAVSPGNWEWTVCAARIKQLALKQNLLCGMLTLRVRTWIPFCLRNTILRNTIPLGILTS